MRRVIAKVIGVHGIRGELKLFPLADSTEIWKDIHEVFISQKKYTVESYRAHKNTILLKLQEIPDRNAAEMMPRVDIEAELSDDLSEDEFYIADLIGLKVFNQDMIEVGSVIDFSQEPQELVLINIPERNLREVLVPFVEEYIMNINWQEHYIQIRLDEDFLSIFT